MKQFLLLMAVVGLAATGCAQNRVMGTHARRGGANMQIARSQAAPQPSIRTAMVESKMEADNQVVQASYGGRCRCGSPGLLGSMGSLLGGKDDCCGGCTDDCCGGDCTVGCECGCPEECCDDTCCGGGCCDSGCCADGCCGDGCCDDGCCGAGGGGCSACGGRGCGLCQRMVGRVASGFCPHGGGYPAAYNYNPSPPTGQVAYPYYTVRGPRDFLQNNPPSIGPY